MGLLAILTGRSDARDESTHTTTNASRYRGVQVVADEENCCAAAQAIAGSRFLPHEVPKLPLENCDSANCQCSFKLFNDRRTDPRRASDFGYDIASELRNSNNRRGRPAGRRSSDQ